MHIKVGKILTQPRTREIDREIDYFLYQKRDIYKSEACSSNGGGKYRLDVRIQRGGQTPGLRRVA